MGRELKRKVAKREGKNVREVQKENMDKPLSPITFGIILGFILLFFVILYVITGLFITKDLKWFEGDNSTNDSSGEEVTITNRILAIDCLRQIEEEYYVYFYDASKEEDAKVSSALANINDKVYRVDLSDSFNANFIGDKSGIVDDVKDLKVSDPTIIKVVSEKITAFYSGADEIEKAF